jgi:hypothetical protein
VVVTVTVTRDLVSGRTVVTVWGATERGLVTAVGRWGITVIGGSVVLRRCVAVNGGDVKAGGGIVIGVGLAVKRWWVEPVLGGVD